MNDNNMWLLRLFQIIRVRGNVFYLVDEEHTYTNVLYQLNVLIDKGQLRKQNNQYILTKQGLQYYDKLCQELGKRGLYKYFMEAEEYKVTKLNPDDIYIPEKSLR